MFVTNPEILSNTVKLNKKVGTFIINYYKIPLLSSFGDYYIFSDTLELRKALNRLPWWVKLWNII